MTPEDTTNTDILHPDGGHSHPDGGRTHHDDGRTHQGASLHRGCNDDSTSHYSPNNVNDDGRTHPDGRRTHQGASLLRECNVEWGPHADFAPTNSINEVGTHPGASAHHRDTSDHHGGASANKGGAYGRNDDHNTSVHHKYASLCRRGWWMVAIILGVLVADQVLKIWVKTHFYLGESVEITQWFQLVFIENKGMAFGWELFGSKLLLTLLRVITVGFLIYYLWRIVANRTARTGYLVCLALIIAGAAGNIIDCAFYGLIFNDPMPPQVATLFPESGGYGTFLHGKVVDMLYFPLCSWTWPVWVPWVGGEYFIFFSPVFNLADAAISVGLIVLLIFYSSQISDVKLKGNVTDKDKATDEDEAEEEEKGNEKGKGKGKGKNK